MTKAPSLAIIGAGIAGLQLARRLDSHFDICVFEKSRGLGGRMSTRRAGAHHFDHGAQYFTAHGAAFRSFLEPFLQEGTVARWSPRLVTLAAQEQEPPVWTSPRFVAVPAMNALCKAMSQGLQIDLSTRIAAIAHMGGGWRLVSEAQEDCGRFDWVVTTAPAEQSMKLIPALFEAGSGAQAPVTQGCYSLMLGFDGAISLPWDAAQVISNPLAWIARNDSKPGRAQSASFLCQSCNDWADTHLEDDQKDVQHMLCAAFDRATGLDHSKASYVSLHRWRFAQVKQAASTPFLLDGQKQLAAAGDWCGSGRVEAGFDSANALADALLSQAQT